MSTPSPSILASQLARIRENGLFDQLNAAALQANLPPSFVIAVASRETNCVNMLGDYQGGEYHGVGILQRDIQHPEARAARDDGSWKTNPWAMIVADVRELANNVHDVLISWQQDAPDDEAYKVAAAGYNCGLERALSAEDAGDCDTHTTGHDYGSDVMARKAVFDGLLA